MARWFSPRLAPRKPSSSLCRAWTLYRPAAATFGWTPCRVVGGGRRGRCLHRTGYVLRLQMAARTPRRVVSRCRRRCQSCPGCGAGPRPARPGRAPSRLPRCPPTASPLAASGPCPWPSQPMGPVTPGCSSRRSPPCGADEPLEVLVLGHGEQSPSRRSPQRSGCGAGQTEVWSDAVPARECAPLRPYSAPLGKGRRPRRRTAPRSSWPTAAPGSTAPPCSVGHCPGSSCRAT